MIELPPILTGDEQNQIQQLRDYLVRLALEPKEETAAANSSSTPTTEGTTDSGNANLNSRISGVDEKVSGMDEKISGMNSKLLTIWESIYPVGSIYMSVSSESPAALFGGTWEQIKDRFLLSSGDTYAVGETGGEAAHTLTETELPAHTHNYAPYMGTVGWSGSSPRNVVKISDIDTYTDTNDDGYLTSLPTGGGAAHNNMPPYLTVYVWKRTA